MKKILAALVAVFMCIMLMFVGLFSLFSGTSSACPTPEETSPSATVPVSFNQTLAPMLKDSAVSFEAVRYGVAAAAEAAGLDAEQITNAQIVISTAQNKGGTGRDALIGVMTAYQETNLRNLPYGTGASRGLFQQTPPYWGTPEQLMDPYYASNAFFERELLVPNRESLPLIEVAIAVQAPRRSAYEATFNDWEPLATELVNQFFPGGVNGTGGPSEPCIPGGPLDGPGGDFPAEECSVVPDPTTGKGCLTPRMWSLARQLIEQGYSVTCWDKHEWNPDSDHPRGKACDVFFGPGGYAAGADKASGDVLNAQLLATASLTGVSYTIWYGIYYDVGSPPKTYCSRIYGCPPTDANGGHYNHIHVSVYGVLMCVWLRRQKLRPLHEAA